MVKDIVNSSVYVGDKWENRQLYVYRNNIWTPVKYNILEFAEVHEINGGIVDIVDDSTFKLTKGSHRYGGVNIMIPSMKIGDRFTLSFYYKGDSNFHSIGGHIGSGIRTNMRINNIKTINKWENGMTENEYAFPKEAYIEVDLYVYGNVSERDKRTTLHLNRGVESDVSAYIKQLKLFKYEEVV